jgi:hypothetical protein
VRLRDVTALAGRLEPFAEEADRKAIERLRDLLGASLAEVAVPKAMQRKLADSAPVDFAGLWPHVEAEAEHRQHRAATQLRARGRAEADGLRGILSDQRRLIEATLAPQQLVLAIPAERAQFEADRVHMSRRARCSRTRRVSGSAYTSDARGIPFVHRKDVRGYFSARGILGRDRRT